MPPLRTRSHIIRLPALAVLILGLYHAHPWRVGLRSVGPVRYGMTLAEVEQILEARIHAGEQISEGCAYTSVPGSPPGTSFMVIDSQLVRFDVDTPGVLTRSGAGVGMTEAEIQRLYPGQIRVEAHPYTGPEGHYLVYQPHSPADSGFGLIFETDGSRVTSYRAGRQPEVSYIEGCA